MHYRTGEHGERLVNYPDYQCRLFRSTARWNNSLHEQIDLQKTYMHPDEKIAIMHVKTLDRQIQQDNFYKTFTYKSAYIVSFTTFTKRFKYVPTMLQSLLAQSYKNFKIVMTLYKDDVPNLTPELKEFIDNGTVELLVADENLKSNLKYYYCMQKYKDTAIITVDDDRVYNQHMIEVLVKTYEQLHMPMVVANNCNYMQFDRQQHITKFSDWNTPWTRPRHQDISFLLFAEGFEGKLYPPSAFKDLDKCKEIIYTALAADDHATKVLELMNRLPICCTNISKYPYSSQNREFVFSKDIDGTEETSLYSNANTGLEYRNEVTVKFDKYLRLAIFLEGALLG